MPLDVYVQGGSISVQNDPVRLVEAAYKDRMIRFDRPGTSLVVGFGEQEVQDMLTASNAFSPSGPFVLPAGKELWGAFTGTGTLYYRIMATST